MQATIPLVLSRQQTAVVNHTHGPALVFAVAGAGKTTAMVHRIERLVSEEQVNPRQILATSFGKANIVDLQNALKQWPHCRPVDCRTLHSLGRRLIVKAQKLGHLAHLKLDTESDDHAAHGLLNKALAAARVREVAFKRELDGLDRLDFLDYVSSCKGNLQYADMDSLDLPDPFRQKAAAAPAPSPQLDWYPALFALFEEARREAGVVTFDDMLRTGWEVLARFPDVLTAVQTHYVHVLVDEFQDINRAQWEILDLITAPQRNYMAIGDDDQCIYEWRGADPGFILKFPDHYQAHTYTIDNNFRCPARPLALANRVIVKNRQRQPKQMALTRGFLGTTAVTTSADIPAMSSHIVEQVQSLLREGVSASDIAILVRLHAQTPPIEQALTNANIPYVVGKPFYDRSEIRTLIHYGRLAWYETRFQTDSRPLNQATIRTIRQGWYAICNRPKRYIAREIRQHVAAQIQRQEQPISAILDETSQYVAEAYLKENLTELALLLRWLSGRLTQPARPVLKELVDRLAFLDYLTENSGFAQTGEGRAASVDAFIDFARGSGTFQAFMGQIKELADAEAGRPKAGRAALIISTMHRAKGLEWPHVIIPQINDGIMPHRSEGVVNMEEERRLFYVALTRTKANLYLHTLRAQPQSPFLRDARPQQTIADLDQLTAVLQKSPAAWQAGDGVTLVATSSRYGLTSYFQNWWDAPDPVQTAAAGRIRQLWRALQTRGAPLPASLAASQFRPWLDMAAHEQTDAPGPFPDLDAFLADLDAAQKRVKGSRSRTPHTKGAAAAPEPATIRPGMWVLCDAGWGKITGIQDIADRPLATVPRENTFIKLAVTLRPGHDNLEAEIDISARQITFDTGSDLFMCTKCPSMATSDASLILKDHNQAAHDGLGPGMKPVRDHRLKLTHYRYRATRPDMLF